MLEHGTSEVISSSNGEYYNTYNAYHDMKKHVLEFTKEQLSCDILFQYTLTIPHPGKWCGKMFEVELYWHEQIQQYTWLKLIGLLPVETLC
jgi:hypothetical protein